MASLETEAMEADDSQAHVVGLVALVVVLSDGLVQRLLEGLDQTPCFPVMAGQGRGA